MDYEYCKDWMLRRYYQWRGLVPARMLYHPDYFRVMRMLKGSPANAGDIVARRLRQVLDTAVRCVPFYRRAVRLTPAEIANEPPQALLERFPYIDKAEVMACQRDFLHERLDPRWLMYAASHGSSGQGIGVWRNKRLADIEKAFYVHEWGKLGFRFDKSRYLRIGTDATRPPDQAPTWNLGNRLMLSPYHIGPSHKAAILAAINRFRPDYVHAYPSSLLSLAELIVPWELDFKLNAVLLASEPASPQEMSLIERLFDCPVSISYGLTERTNLAFASHAQGATGPYRFEELYGINENLWANGHAEIVGTSLWNDVMPLVRYRTGDFGVIDELNRCSTIVGRDHEFVVDRTGNRIPGLSIVIETSAWDFIRTCQIRQHSPGALRILVVARHGTLTPEQRTLIAVGPRKRWKNLFEITVDEVAEIPPAPGGKRQFVVNECCVHGQ